MFKPSLLKTKKSPSGSVSDAGVDGTAFTIASQFKSNDKSFFFVSGKKNKNDSELSPMMS